MVEEGVQGRNYRGGGGGPHREEISGTERKMTRKRMMPMRSRGRGARKMAKARMGRRRGRSGEVGQSMSVMRRRRRRRMQ